MCPLRIAFRGDGHAQAGDRGRKQAAIIRTASAAVVSL